MYGFMDFHLSSRNRIRRGLLVYFRHDGASGKGKGLAACFYDTIFECEIVLIDFVGFASFTRT